MPTDPNKQGLPESTPAPLREGQGPTPNAQPLRPGVGDADTPGRLREGRIITPQPSEQGRPGVKVS